MRHRDGPGQRLALGLAPLYTWASRWLRVGLGAAAAAGALLSLVAVSTTPQPPEIYARPVRELLWPAFREGDLSLNHQSFLEPGAAPRRLRGGELRHDAWNLGEKMGLVGHTSLAPLALTWLLLGSALFWPPRR